MTTGIPMVSRPLAALKDDPAAVQALVAAEGFDATPEEIREAFLETFGSELSEEQLAAIAGGLSDDDTALIIGAVGGVVGALPAVAVAWAAAV
jgi:hypothetical protein